MVTCVCFAISCAQMALDWYQKLANKGVKEQQLSPLPKGKGGGQQSHVMRPRPSSKEGKRRYSVTGLQGRRRWDRNEPV